jgi:hypothetical protein
VLAVLAVMFWWLGGSTLRRSAAALAIALVLAVSFSVGVYYRHFGDVYVNALRVRTGAPAATAADANSAQPPKRGSAAVAAPFHVRTGRSLRLVAESIGWPILILAAVGAWRLAAQPGRDPLRLALAASAVTFVVFFAVGVMRVGPEYERYSLEFVGRVAHATYPAAVIAAGWGAAWAWRAGGARRAAALALFALAIAGGITEWIQWR